MRRVLHVMASGSRGGGARHLLGLLPWLQAQGMAVSALVGDDGPLREQLNKAGIQTQAAALMGARWDRRWWGWLEAALDRLRPDLVHYHGSRAGFWGGWMRLARAEQRSVYTAHGLASRVARPWGLGMAMGLAETVACRADAVISVSRADLDVLVATHGLAQRRGHHVGNAVDLPSGTATAKAARARLGLDEGVPWVGCVARLAPQKAVADLLDAMQDCPSARLAVIGDGPQRAQLARHPQVIAGRARLLGARDDVPQCLPAFDAFALSSHWEGEPIALLEAMAQRLPCVVTRTSGAMELVRHDDTGVLVDIGNPAQLAAALRALLEDKPARKRLGARARAFAEGRSHARAAAQVMAIYAKVLGDAALQRTAQAGMQSQQGAAHARIG